MSDIHLIKGLGAEKKLGQNFLVDPHYIERELSYCNTKGKNVLEIGSGVGALTVGLAKDAKSFLAIEIDERFIPILKEKLLEFKHAKVICGDALEFVGGPFDLVVSNVPYYVASKMVLKISKLGDEAVICIQRELANRMVAEPCSRDYSRFSVICQLLFETDFLGAVPSGAFYPKPDVGSAIVRLKKIG
ncbi:MAG: 16S rRNA (adenine(1518)-N(6)/adenine(1519)-N(6))-dimethyltransferase RsmA, partial [Candidatus Micrarchaeota archaeon]